MKFYIRFTTEDGFGEAEITKLAKRARLETDFRETPYDADIAIATVYASTDKELKNWAKKHLPRGISFKGPFANKSSAAQKENNMNEQVKNILANIVQNKPILAAKSFKDVIDSKLNTALEVRKVGLTSDIYNKSTDLKEGLLSKIKDKLNPKKAKAREALLKMAKEKEKLEDKHGALGGNAKTAAGRAKRADEAGETEDAEDFRSEAEYEREEQAEVQEEIDELSKKMAEISKKYKVRTPSGTALSRSLD